MIRCVGWLALGLWLPLSASAEVVVQRLSDSPMDLRAYAAERAEPQRPMSEIREMGKLFSQPSTSLLLPSFTVDTTNPSGVTTLFAVRNLGGMTETISLIYLDESSNILANVSDQLATNEVLPINLRDVSAVTASADANGVAEGVVVVAGSSDDAKLVGDYFIADPGNDFATGGRLLEIENPACALWGIRFLSGGVFSGGTLLRLLLLSPQGGSPGNGSPTLIANVYDESGTFIDNQGLWTDDRVVNIPVQTLAGGVSAGSLEILMAGDGGFVSADFSASGRYSVGLDGTCIEPLMSP